ncbi:MAG: glycoside hydrolase domain-containing protein [Victivallaceae bacterium]
MKSYSLVIATVTLMIATNLVAAGEIKLETYLFRLSDNPLLKFKQWNKTAKKLYIVNFDGLCTDEENPGKKLHKIDITFTDSGNIILSIPSSIPVVNKITSRFIYSAKVPQRGSLSLGFLLKMSPGFGGYVIKRPVKVAGKWNVMQINNIFEHCKKSALDHVARTYYKDIDAKNLTPYITDICLYLKGRKGQRFTIVFKDIEVAGKVPSLSDMDKIAKQNWAPVREKLEFKIRTWCKQIEVLREKISVEKLNSLYANKQKELITKKINECFIRIEQASRRGFIRRKQEEQLVTTLNELDRHDLKGIDEYMKREKNACYIPYIVNPISDQKILPDSTFIIGQCKTKIKLTATPGEFEPASFVIHAIKAMHKITLIPTGLKNEISGRNLSASNIDIRLVKCWYQAGGAWVSSTKQDRNRKILVPELLLKNDGLVKVDREKKKNYLLLDFPSGTEYRWISNPQEKSERQQKVLLTDDFPVKDSSILMPINIKNRTNQQFWITIKVPADLLPGNYSGNINLYEDNKEIGAFELELKVLPFRLAAPYYTSSIYYRGRLSNKYKNGTISADYKSSGQLAVELANLLAHGVDNPICYQVFADRIFMDKYLEIREKAGIARTGFYSCDFSISKSRSYGIDKLKERIKNAVKYLTGKGFQDVYFYGVDEATGDRLKAQRREWNAIHAAGGKVFVAGSRTENYEQMGDIQDLLVCAGVPCREEAAQWHSKNHKIWCYGNPQGGMENPAAYRRNYGLLLWQNDYDGAATFAYQAGYGNIWNDFDGRYRDENFTYPTLDGVIDTIAWEGYREAIDDVRYVTTLIREIEQAKKENSPEKQKIITEAEKYLNNLKETDIMELDLDGMRLKIAEYIIGLQK